MRKLINKNTLSKKQAQKNMEKEIEKTINPYLAIFGLVSICTLLKRIFNLSIEDIDAYLIEGKKLKMQNEILNDKYYPRIIDTFKAYLKITHKITEGNEKIVNNLNSSRLERTYKKLMGMIKQQYINDTFKNENLSKKKYLDDIVNLLASIQVVNNSIFDIKNSTEQREDLIKIIDKKTVARLRRISTIALDTVVYPIWWSIKKNTDYYDEETKIKLKKLII